MKFKNISSYNYDKTISYDLYIYYNNLVKFSNNKKLLKNIDDNKYDILCKKLLIIYNKLFIYKFNVLKQFTTLDEITNLSLFKTHYIKNILNKNINKTDKNLVITNSFTFIKSINDYSNQNYKFHLQLFENEEMTNIQFNNLFEKTKKLKVIESYENNTVLKYLKIKQKNKYNNIFCKINEYKHINYLNVFTLTKIPNILFIILQSLKQLNKNGKLVIFTRISLINKTLKKIIYLLSNSFDKINIIYNNYDKTDSNIILNCNNFKHNISTQLINDLINICSKSRKNNYSLCQFMNYFYYINKTKPEKSNFKFNHKEIENIKLNNIKQKEIQILDDIDINPKKTKEGDLIIFQMEQIYEQYFENIKFNILNYIKIENNKIKIEHSFFDKLLYEKLVTIISIFEENKIPYNKTYLVYINKYNNNLVNKLYGFVEPIHYHLVKYNKQKSIKKSRSSLKKSLKKRSFVKDRNILEKISSYKSYHYDQLDDIQDANILSHKVKTNLIESIPTKDLKTKLKTVKKATEGLTRGISQYILMNYNLPYKISNGYIKLWELYSLVPQLVPRRKQLNVFHLAEAPGQWINCTTHFIETKRQQTRHYNWIANSLNPKHPENIKKYGKGIFDDAYGFLKRFPQKWLYGVDDTGDITKSKNVRWFRDYIKKFNRKSSEPIHLITGDAGMGSDISLKDLQKIEFAQLCMVAACSSIGTNCVIKHFLHFINNYENSYEGSGYFISFIYLYYLMFEEIRLIKPNTSNPNSREFYLVGLKFKGINDSIFNKLMKQLDNFDENHCFFKKEDIPEFFYRQVLDFIKDIFNLNTEQYELQNMLFTCIVNPDPVIEKATQCKKYLDIDFIKKIQTKRYKEWIKTHQFK